MSASRYLRDVAVDVGVVFKDLLFDQVDKRPARVDLPARSAEHGKVLDRLFEVFGFVLVAERAELLDECRVLGRDGRAFYLFCIIIQ